VDELILASLTKQGQATIKALSSATGLPAAAVKAALLRLEEEGLVCRRPGPNRQLLWVVGDEEAARAYRIRETRRGQARIVRFGRRWRPQPAITHPTGPRGRSFSSGYES
jgi:DNA-binding MarR family transcriptional regulator